MTGVTASLSNIAPTALLRTLRSARTIETDVPNRLVTVGAVGAIVAVAGLTFLHYVNFFVFDRRYDIIDADAEANVPTWGGASVTFAAAVGALVLAVAARGRERIAYGALALILTFFSVDDAVGLHEKFVLGTVGPIEQAERFVWPLLYLPVLVTALVLIIRIAQSTFARARASILLGLCLLVLAVVAELAGGVMQNAFGVTYDSFPYSVEVVIEEGLELAGWILIGTGLLATAIHRAADLTARRA